MMIFTEYGYNFFGLQLQQRWSWQAVTLDPPYGVFSRKTWDELSMKTEVDDLLRKMQNWRTQVRCRAALNPQAKRDLMYWDFSPQWMLVPNWTLSSYHFPTAEDVYRNWVVLDDMAFQHLGYVPYFFNDYPRSRFFVWLRRLRWRAVKRALRMLPFDVVRNICKRLGFRMHKTTGLLSLPTLEHGEHRRGYARVSMMTL